MKSIELFAGEQCFSQVARSRGHKTFTTDIKPLKGIDYVVDIFDFDVNRVPFIPDIIWASVDCKTWSIAAGNIHFDSRSLVPKTQAAAEGFKMVDVTMAIITYFLGLNANLNYYIENPVGKLQYYLGENTLFGVNVPRMVTIDQCQYGRDFKKPTHIFTNDLQWKPLPRCQGRANGCQHQENIKNTGTGTNSSLGKLDNARYYERSKIPFALSESILMSAENQLLQVSR